MRTSFSTTARIAGKNSDPKIVSTMEKAMVHVLAIPETWNKQEFGYFTGECEVSTWNLRKKTLPPSQSKPLETTPPRVQRFKNTRSCLLQQ